ncbi:hypothetical protein V6N13_064572 [Hibiscus sabdariffa]|uniref:Bifunctional inhibitor/plant lipid transfer protein/seed storage helical domain-containing protein n=1 Tax=Hibiscus sabdariffa TaxID=183260 RepID=A0ABR2EAH0_9ROSI
MQPPSVECDASLCGYISYLLSCITACMCGGGLGAPLAQGAITCGQVSSALVPCLPYLKSGGTVPPACCNGIKSLNSAAQTTPDRQAACN